MTIKEAIKEIKDRVELESRHRIDQPDYIEALELAVDALEKQELVKPTKCHVEPMYQGWHYQDQVRTKEARMTKLYFCPRCGQAVGWEVE